MKDKLKENGRIVCPAHAPKPGHYVHLKPEYFIGKHVKKAFAVTNNPKFKVEHMWVHVHSVEGEQLVGHLENEPWFIDKSVIKNGDAVRMTVAEVESVEGLQ